MVRAAVRIQNTIAVTNATARIEADPPISSWVSNDSCRVPKVSTRADRHREHDGRGHPGPDVLERPAAIRLDEERDQDDDHEGGFETLTESDERIADEHDDLISGIRSLRIGDQGKPHLRLRVKSRSVNARAIRLRQQLNDRDKAGPVQFETMGDHGDAIGAGAAERERRPGTARGDGLAVVAPLGGSRVTT